MKSKKILCFAVSIIIVLQLVLTSCSKLSDKNTIQQPEESKSDSNNQATSKAWDAKMSSYDVNVPYKLPEYTPNVKEYKVNKDLSDLFNDGQYYGFTKEQKKSIYEDGFVVLKPSRSALMMHHIYEMPMYKESPVFITVDSALHMYHLFYDNSLKLTELTSLYDKLESLSGSMVNKSLECYNKPEYQNLKEELKFISAYFLTACKLMDTDLGENVNVPSEISSLADSEVKLIEEASDFKQSPILKKDIDYSQYTVRGHYTGNEKLTKYFKTMMWYGQCGFPVFDEKSKEKKLDTDNVIKGMIITSLALCDDKIFENYENIYSTTALYTGLSDDLGVFAYRDMIINVYGANPDINIYKDSSYYDKLLDEALKLPEPKIQPKYTTVSTPAGKQFRFMGQRYSFDAETMQNLIEPILRPVPSGLDVISAFGNKRAEELLDVYYKPKESWPNYEEEMNKMREKEKSISDEEWKSDLYNGWLWSIKSSVASFEQTEGMPKFMRNRKWTDKNIHTALGSFAELKHDSILYKKQSGAEMGAGPEISFPYNYVEPNVEVYAKLKWLAENTRENLKARGMLDEENEEILNTLLELQETLMNVSVKELTNQNITEEENMKLYTYGGKIDFIFQSLIWKLKNAGINDDDVYTSALIADVSTVAPNSNVQSGSYLEIGNGLPCEIYVVCSTNGKTYLAKGAIFNYYEFLSDKRMTDVEWHCLLGIKKVGITFDEQSNDYIRKEIYDDKGQKILNEEYDFEDVQISEQSSYMVTKPEWTKSFMSEEENKVEIQNDMKLDWNK